MSRRVANPGVSPQPVVGIHFEGITGEGLVVIPPFAFQIPWRNAQLSSGRRDERSNQHGNLSDKRTTPAPETSVRKTAEGANASYMSTYAQQRNVTSEQEQRVSRGALPLDKTHCERVNSGHACHLYEPLKALGKMMPCSSGSRKSCPPHAAQHGSHMSA
ncbi:hypothetical protein Q8A73_014313 [Channa argus]|nr:hypothetical protein Q8A73_014313 [Channa argus]